MARSSALLVGTCALFLTCAFHAAAWRPSAVLDGLAGRLGFTKPQAPEEQGALWALLVAGSSSWGNYRHQADVCHAFQVLKHGGVPEENIVVMMANDIAGNFMNPHQGQIFNKPGGPNVYEGVPLDYTGGDVTAANMLKVLAGDEPMPGGSGKTIKSGPDDRVFVFYSDHGAPGVVGMPTGPFLYADQLHNAMQAKRAKRGFKEAVLYIEACESGSMFEGLNYTDALDIYVTTAANAVESSWGTYCPGMNPPPPPELTTCLGDLYSVAWMEDSDHSDLTEESLEKQYELVRKRTSANYTYMQGSHVMQYGALAIDEEPAAEYLGQANTGGAGLGAPLPVQESVPQRDADLIPLRLAVERATTPEARAAAEAALAAELARRKAADAGVRSAVAWLLAQPDVRATIQATFQNSNLLLGEVPQPGAWTLEAVFADPTVNMFVTQPLPRPAGAALVDDWDCLRGMVGAWEAVCGPMDQYAMQHTRAFANLCNAGLKPDRVLQAANAACRPVSAAS